jgi:general stress protein 26
MEKTTGEKIGDLIAKSKTAFIASVDGEGFPNLKAMIAPRVRDGLKTFYFTTNASSRRAAQYRANPKAAVYFYERTLWSYSGVQLIGTMKVLTDLESKRMVWRPGDTMYYPGGVGDPDYCVLKFTAARGRYYHNFKHEDFQV